MNIREHVAKFCVHHTVLYSDIFVTMIIFLINYDTICILMYWYVLCNVQKYLEICYYHKSYYLYHNNGFTVYAEHLTVTLIWWFGDIDENRQIKITTNLAASLICNQLCI